MSRIFDALQRAEGERSKTDVVGIPEGTDLIREAERRAASDWDAVTEVPVANSEAVSAGFLTATQIAGAPSFVDGLLSIGERTELLNQCQSVPISLPADSRIASLLDRRSPTAEAVRLLAVRLRDFRRSRTLKRVVVTSSIPREGKSTIATNLACSLARRDEEKVLLIEGDLRVPVVFRMFGLDQRPGICELLRGECTLTESIYRLPDAGIWVLPAGVTTSNPLELIQSPKTASFMDQLSACFDWIIIDSPPVLPLADTSIWMRLADGVLLVTRQGVTEKKQLKKGLEALEPSKVLGALLNGSKASKYSEYYYGKPRQE